MTWKVQYLADEDVVQVTAQGLHDRAMLRELTRDAVAAGHRHGTPRFLIDHRLTRLALGTAEIFDMPKRGEDAGFGNQLRIAILIDADGPARADFEFYAVQCGNLGIHFMRLFFDRDQAMEWLKSDRRPPG
ncbi:hypothetical protein [Arenimonas donghaensis]|uniref:STAS/SEC14 domain-containing protein n=1 Tax=Arenimonas donghaensis DSM 18148 = HO3-R19 TaxID=1121014 RepID=A0A087MGV0_9GAMM|nr:hypothetical protein [Arenimonas donghaensis]KFL36103.1 hypothetical protein N788_06025 [Arenimonas donghaensis DSM 18148 = HO3-R19]